MKKIFCIVSAFAFALTGSTQECFKVKQGQNMRMTSYRYSNDEVFLPAWYKMSEEKKDKKVGEFNAKVLGGTIQPSGTFDNQYAYKTVTADNNTTRAIISTVIADKEYLYEVVCKNDTLFCARHIGPNYTVVNGDTTGMGLLGIQVLPNSMKVGDVLQPYEDINVEFPKTKEYMTEYKKQLGKSVSYSSQSILTTYYFKVMDVKVKESLSFGANTINYAVAKVMAEEEVTIDGTKHKAFRIESESWTKGKIEKTFEASNAEWQAEKQRQEAELMAKMEKRGIKKGYTNKLGYIVSYRTEWFVPGIGMAKMELYDASGNIMARSSIESIK